MLHKSGVCLLSELKISWEKAKDGDQQEIELIVTKYYKVAYKIAHRWARTGQIEESEAVGLSNIAIMKCIRKGFFDEEKGYKFTSYLCSAVNNEIRMFLRKDRKEKSKLAFSMDQPLPLNGPAGSNDDKATLTYGEAFLDDNTVEDCLEDQFLLEEAQGILCEVLPELNEVEFDCFMLYINGCLPKNIGEELGFSKNYPHKILAGVKAKFREKLESEDWGVVI